jgi:hypothetical protein
MGAGVSSWRTRGGVPYDIGFGLPRPRDARALPQPGPPWPTLQPGPPWLTWLAPSSATLCHGRPYHCSSAKDVTTPLAATDTRTHAVLALYEVYVWPALWGHGGADDAHTAAADGDGVGAGVAAAVGAAVGAGCVVAAVAALLIARRRILRRARTARPVVHARPVEEVTVRSGTALERAAV